jgi:carboxyl-terminal processing protease
MIQRPSARYLWLPFVLGLVLAGGIYLGTALVPERKTTAYNKIGDVLDYIQQEYVDTVSRGRLVDMGIEKMLEQLDPHSAYIPAEDLQSANEPLEGNFEGIGIEFHLQSDSIMVVSVISGGPSERVGLMAGDRIVKVDGKNVANKGLANEDVFKLLRGKGGTMVTVTVYRNSISQLREFQIIRGKIPINSVDIAYMASENTGYIKINRFAATTYDEFMSAMQNLQEKGMRNLILDLRGNPGGYLDASTKIADEFLGGRKLIVYTKGRSRPRTNYYTDVPGAMEKGDVVVLVDEGSASASEIVAGALQDWDRATIMGRRSFGKGLVQEQTVFPDGSAMRLTIARYYTPTGRSIQKPYDKGLRAYEDEVYERYVHGEFESEDSIRFADSLKYKTPKGKIVYGGGGIMPDVFVARDTTYDTDMFQRILATGAMNQFAYDYVDKHRKVFSSYEGAEEFREKFEVTNAILEELIAFSATRGVLRKESELKRSAPLLKNNIKAYIGRLLYQNQGLYPVLHEYDHTFQKAMEVLQQQGV